ncbi:MurR/RpiR family transcriptional regulator [Amaricoccus solimangrovi]|nr:MurR/RpiR family transcriptional regulator [Amaricoccus solimangrovi]
MKRPEEVATYSLRHVARQAELPPQTFSRLARAIGCETYDELREMCRAEFRLRSARFADRVLGFLEGGDDTQAARPGTREPLLVRHAAATISNIQSLLESVDLERLEATAEQLARARRVALLGSLSSAVIADYLGYVCGMALPNWTVLGRGGPLSGQIIDLGPEDAAIVLGFEPFARRTIRGARLIAEQGARLVCVTDSHSSPLTEVAGEVFWVRTASPQFFPSQAAVMVLVETLIGLVVRRAGARAQERLARIDLTNATLHEHWSDEIDRPD